MGKYTDSEIITLLSKDGEKAIKALFDQYYNYMCHAVYRIMPDRVMVEDIVQEVFYELWRKREKLNITTSLKAYLRRACINKTLNHIRDQKIKFDDEDKIYELDLSTSVDGQEQMEATELQTLINKTIDALPAKCRIIFSMSRFEDMKYKEIAHELNISVKTVENQISKALKLLRLSIEPHLNRT